MQYAAEGASWFFWTWKVDAHEHHGNDGEAQWDFRRCVERGWLDPRWWGGEPLHPGLAPNEEAPIRMQDAPDAAEDLEAEEMLRPALSLARTASIGHVGGLVELVGNLSLLSAPQPPLWPQPQDVAAAAAVGGGAFQIHGGAPPSAGR